MVPATQKEPEGWNAADKFTAMLETARLNATEFGAYCRERGLFPELGGPLVSGSPGCQYTAGADGGRAEEPREAPPAGSERDQPAALL